MSCPYCEQPTDVLDDIHHVDTDGGLRWPYVDVIYNAHCENCGKRFRQRYPARMDDCNYENIIEEVNPDL